MVKIRYRWLFFIFLMIFMLSWQMLEAAENETETPETGQNFDRGVRVEFYAEPVSGPQIRAGEDLKVGFRITDSVSGEASTHLHPAAWLTHRRPESGKPDQATCENEIGALLRRGLIHTKADADLNSFYILTLNVDSSIGIIDPTVNINTANLLALVRFEGESAEWALDEDYGMAYVTLPQKGKVAVADLGQRTLKEYLDVGAGTRRIELPPDGRYVWVANEGIGTVSVIDRENQSVVHTLEVGPGPMDLAVDEKERFAFLGSGKGGHLSIIDIQQMKQVTRLEVGEGDPAMAWSPLGALLYLVNKKNGMVKVIDPEQRKIVNRFDLSEKISAFKATPDGRFILAIAPEKRLVKVIDTALNRVTGELATETEPDQIIFTSDYAYIRNRGTANISVIQLGGLANPSRAGVVSVPIGVTPPDQVKELVKGNFDVNPMAVFPHGGHILALNPADKTVFLYMEGMMVPMNSFKTYTARPMGLMVYNRGLREGKVEGDYTAIVRLEEAGTYNVPFYLESPLVAECFELVVHENPEIVRTRPPKPSFSGMFGDVVFQPGQVARIQFRLIDEETGAPIPDVNDVIVMSFLQRSHWQHRVVAEHIGEGVYEADFIFPREGKYKVLIEARSLGISFGDLRHEFANVAKAEDNS